MNDPCGTRPPRLATWLLHWQCVPEQLEALEGDLLELHERRLRARGKGHADAYYWRDTLSACVRQGRLIAWLVRAHKGRGIRRLALWTVSFLVASMLGPVVDRPLYLIPLFAGFFYIDFALGPKVFRAWASIAVEIWPSSWRSSSDRSGSRPSRGRVESWLLLLYGALGGFVLVVYALIVELVRWAVRGAGSAQPYLNGFALLYVGALLLLGASLGARGALLCLLATGGWALIALVRARKARRRCLRDGSSADR